MVRETFEITAMKNFSSIELKQVNLLTKAIDLARSCHDARPETLNCFERDGAEVASIAGLN
jgi:hypothetical protein